MSHEISTPARGHSSEDQARIPLVDEEVRARVSRRALDATLFVEAGAGTGKTTQLVSRVVNLVLHQGAPLASIAAITFTEAAARELQSRIRAAFEKRQASALGDQDTELARQCADAIADSDLAAITTLHGFANRILGEFAVAAGLPPRVSVLDEVSSQLAKEDRWQRFVDQLYASNEHTELLQAASVLGIKIEPSYENQATMRLVASEFSQNWDRLDSIIGPPTQPFRLDVDFAALDHAVHELRLAREQCVDPQDKLCQHIGTLLPQMEMICGIQDPLRKIVALKSAPRWGPGNGGRKDAWPVVDKDDVKTMIKNLELLKDELLGPVTNEVLHRLSALIAAHVVTAAQARRRQGGLEFHDLLVLARDLLRTNDFARHALHERYRHVLLDEFQDTDPIQIELGVLIATSATQVGNTPWHQLPVDPGRLFFVGDPKQSIYRFRRADIALFLAARRQFSGEHGVQRLRANFRTVEPIVAWVNTLFGRIMAEEVPDRQPRYEPLVATRQPATAATADRHLPVLLGGPTDDPGTKAAELRSNEARDVAGIVQAILAEPDQWPVLDRATETWRPARLDDVTILLPTRTSLPFLRSALEDADVHYRITTGTLVYGTQEVADALAALRAVDDPGDELSLVAALRSPLYGCSDVDLLEWRQAGGRWDVRSHRPQQLRAEHPVAAAIAHLQTLWNERWFMTPSALLERLLRERHAALLAFGDPRPVDVWRRLRFLVEQARAFEEANSGDLRAFTQWAALQSGALARVHEPLLPETDQRALSIQTIHGSKGLEFPITILSGMTTQFGTAQRGVSVLWSQDGTPSVRIQKGIETHDHGLLADLEATMDQYEKLRLAYVATTRARDHLIVSCHHKPSSAGDRSYGEIVWSTFGSAEEEAEAEVGGSRRVDWEQIVSATDEPEAVPTQLGLALDDRDAWIRDRAALLAPNLAPRVLSATAVARSALLQMRRATEGGGSTPTDAQTGLDEYRLEPAADQDDDRADQPPEVPLSRRRGRVGTSIGSAVHGVLQLVDLASLDALDGSAVADLVTEQCAVHFIDDHTGIVRRLVQVALESPAVELASRHRHHKELFVAAPLGERSIEGYVDLLIETPQGLVVVDYKTDAVRSQSDIDDKLAVYTLQAAAYALALEVSTGLEVVECRFVFLTGDVAIERSVPDLDAAKAQARRTVLTNWDAEAAGPEPVPTALF